MKVLALDVATVTGVCVGEAGTNNPRLSSIYVENEDLSIGQFLLGASKQYRTLIKTEAPDLILIESPVKNPFDSLIKLRKILGLLGCIETIAAELKIKCKEIDPKKVKLVLSGDGRAKKDHQILAAMAMGFTPASHDESDALGLWLLAVASIDKQSIAYWRTRQDNISWRQNLEDIRMCNPKKPKTPRPKKQLELI